MEIDKENVINRCAGCIDLDGTECCNEDASWMVGFIKCPCYTAR